MLRRAPEKYKLIALFLSLFLTARAFAQSAPESLPDPYQQGIENWAKLPDGRTWGSAAGISVDSKGNIWVFERCGVNSCAGRTEDPILEFDRSGHLVKSFGSGMFVFPHSIFVDKDDNVWVSDADGKDGKGQQVVKFSPDGKVLMTLGKAGVAGDGPDTFNRPSGVVVAPNGNIFVSDGHGGDSNARIVKFSKDGKFIKAWGKKGTGPGEFGELHAIAMDPKGRIFVADRGNLRIQIFDQDGNFLDQWTQYGRPSGIAIDKHGTIYVAGIQSGIRVGNTNDGKLTALIPPPKQDPGHGGMGPEGVAADDDGSVYGAEVNRKMVVKYVKQ
jgi:DNA-binding beta-propeller fold protein YncE